MTTSISHHLINGWQRIIAPKYLYDPTYFSTILVGSMKCNSLVRRTMVKNHHTYTQLPCHSYIQIITLSKKKFTASFFPKNTYSEKTLIKLILISLINLFWKIVNLSQENGKTRNMVVYSCKGEKWTVAYWRWTCFAPRPTLFVQISIQYTHNPRMTGYVPTTGTKESSIGCRASVTSSRVKPSVNHVGSAMV